MTTTITDAPAGWRTSSGEHRVGSDTGLLRTCAIAAGLICSALFVAVGLSYGLQQYADGSMFSYSVAVNDVWAFHWHNISCRLFVYLVNELPAELYVQLTNDPRGGVAIYGGLFFAAQLIGLMATWAADRSPGRVIFAFAGASTAVLCPLVFGFPSELWVAHAVFWPTLAVCHYARRGVAPAMLLFAMVLALVFAHEAGLILAALIVGTALLRGWRDATFVRAAAALVVAAAIWGTVKLAFPPDAYDGPMMLRAEQHFFDLAILRSYILVLLAAAGAGYAALFLVLRRFSPARAHLYAALLIALGLAAYWLLFAQHLHAAQRYPMRTILFLGTMGLGALGSVYAVDAENRLAALRTLLPRVLTAAAGKSLVRALIGALAVVLLLHGVETAEIRHQVDGL